MPFTEANGAWSWTHDCRVGPIEGERCAPSAPNVGTAQLAGNTWNLGGDDDTTGALRMAIDADGTAQVRGELSDAPPCTRPDCVAPEANTWVRGFPSVVYGLDLCSALTSPPQAAELQLPMRVGDIPSSLVGTTTYTAEPSHITYTIAYDLWLNPSDTRDPCRADGTIEVMVWTDHDAEARLPDSLRSANTTIPYAIDGVAHDGTDAWVVYSTNVYGDGATAPWGGTVWFVLDQARVTNGTVSVDLSAALAATAGLLEQYYGWRDFAGTYWLDTIAFGIEFGPTDGQIYGDTPIDFSLDLTAYCLVIGGDVRDASC